MYTMLMVQFHPDQLQADDSTGIQAFMQHPTVLQAIAGKLPGCTARNPLVFELAGDYLRALVRLQRAADDAQLHTVLLQFGQQHAAILTSPVR